MMSMTGEEGGRRIQKSKANEENRASIMLRGKHKVSFGLEHGTC
ncbi:MAG: hypothetical protein N2V77_02145 [Canidatus Methanoxibalbensis ujae]|nr:hypothetical protein [Candidatus Methanoxibalbensis ujae]